MTKINFCGRDYECCESMSEIKKWYANDSFVINRFYNRNQMVNYYRNKLINDNIDPNDPAFTDYKGKLFGYDFYENSNVGVMVSLYKIEDLSTDVDAIEERENDWDCGGCCFFKDKTGQIFYLEIFID